MDCQWVHSVCRQATGSAQCVHSYPAHGSCAHGGCVHGRYVHACNTCHVLCVCARARACACVCFKNEHSSCVSDSTSNRTSHCTGPVCYVCVRNGTMQMHAKGKCLHIGGNAHMPCHMVCGGAQLAGARLPAHHPHKMGGTRLMPNKSRPAWGCARAPHTHVDGCPPARASFWLLID